MLFVVREPEFQWLASAEILAEYEAVLRRPKFALPSELVDEWLTVVRNATLTPQQPPPPVPLPRDMADAKFLSCALAGKARYLITGDRDLSTARRVEGLTVLTVSRSLDLVAANW